MTKELTDILKYLRLGNLLAHWEDYLKLAADRNFSHARLLTHVLEEEYQTQTRECPPTPAQSTPTFPKSWSSRPIPSSASPSSTRSGSWLSTTPWTTCSQHQNLIWLGVTGCGKTGLATSFLVHAIDQGYRGRYVLFAEPGQRTLRRRRRPFRKPGPQKIPRL